MGGQWTRYDGWPQASLVTDGSVNTMPAATALADHGVISGDTIRSRYHATAAAMQDLAAVGIALDASPNASNGTG